MGSKLPKITGLLESLPDDLLLCLLRNLAASASSPADLFSIATTCKRLNRLVMHPLVLSRVGPMALSVKPKSWSQSAHRFLFQCVAAGSTEASYTLGMIRFYCLESRVSGLSLMAKAAMRSHAPALYSLAVIQINGSGGASRSLESGVALAHRAACLGDLHALRELWHCLQDGFDAAQRRSLLSSVVRAATRRHLKSSVLDAPDPEFGFHPVHRFMREWFDTGRAGIEPALRLCSQDRCGRAESRVHEFRRCSVCGKVNYCSRGCQALDWRVRHKVECVAVDR